MATNHEIARLRALAEQGVHQAEAARLLGHHRHWVAYWVKREKLVFADGRRVIAARTVQPQLDPALPSERFVAQTGSLVLQPASSVREAAASAGPL
jgi:hypothetical protein